jgi:hypothetical protein
VEIVEAPADDAWDAFCATSPGAWFWHTTAWRDYTLAYRPDLASTSRAFFVTDGSEVAAAVPLMAERHGTTPMLSFGGGDCWAPAFAPGLATATQFEVMRAALAHVDQVAGAEGAVRVSFRQSPLAPASTSFAPFLAETTRAGYADMSALATVLDVSQPTDLILRRMSKGHRSDISRAARSLSVEVFDAATITAAAFDEYRQLHALAAGRVTRPARTFELMARWIELGRALLLTARQEGRLVSCAYLNLYGEGAYYSSAATEPSFRQPAGHLLQWAAIERLHAHGFGRYELGLQQFGPLPHDVPTVKELNISRFKRGFGGALVPVPVREKWFDAGTYRRVSSARAAAYSAALDAVGPGANELPS